MSFKRHVVSLLLNAWKPDTHIARETWIDGYQQNYFAILTHLCVTFFLIDYYSSMIFCTCFILTSPSCSLHLRLSLFLTTVAERNDKSQGVVHNFWRDAEYYEAVCRRCRPDNISDRNERIYMIDSTSFPLYFISK